ncbi:MAG: glutamine-hydrolyzing GMP synthase [Ezakiella sp.]|nr:glutamine-hydrolyzing GMP synthase [Ezakiella sp.]MDD7472504.1 glutamine-hydrolyzing GMP synthase [Bacillota bacterium]MDY3923253.1 glutamine-hydrolyzing GMP synthase [Ezakiella sp.]
MSVIILDFKGQYCQLIARRVRELGVFSKILPGDATLEEIKAENPSAIILTGGPDSVYEQDAIHPDKDLFTLKIPMLGICYGAQLMSYMLGGVVQKADPSEAEYGKAVATYKDSPLFDGLESGVVWMSHMDYIDKLPEGFKPIATTKNCATAAIADENRKFYATQFHPEVNNTEHQKEIFKNFLFKIANITPDWNSDNFIDKAIEDIKSQIGDGYAILGLSGGVDSSVAAALVAKAIGERLTCIFVDHGLLRMNEAEEVEKVFKEKFNVKFIKVDAKDRFLSKLKGVTEPEKKRKIIGEEFIRVFEDAKKDCTNAKFLVQGTIYPDVVESGLKKGDVIKSHHNVGGLPEDVDFELVEPLRMLFKDEVRSAGKILGLPENMVMRHPFPGPGLAIRIIGEITEEKLDILRRVDKIYIDMLHEKNLYNEIWQAFAVLPDIKTVGVQGDRRTYSYMCALRAVRTKDAMTAESYPFTWEFLDEAQRRIINAVPEVNRVVYDITSKPPGTIEWE